VLRAIWASSDAGLWAAWAALARPIDVPYGEANPELEWDTILQAIRHDSSALSRILHRYPEALDYLIVLADSDPQSSDLALELTGDAKRLIRVRLEREITYLSGLARLADDRTLPRSLRTEAWTKVVRGSKDEVVHAIAYLIARTSGAAASDVAVSSFARLYRTLRGDDGAAAWDRLRNQIYGDRNSWDRCDRITEDLVRLIRSYPSDARVESLKLLRSENPTAINAVEQRLRGEMDKEKRKKFRVWDPSTW
jgi:hypothetical protein